MPRFSAVLTLIVKKKKKKKTPGVCVCPINRLNQTDNIDAKDAYTPQWGAIPGSGAAAASQSPHCCPHTQIKLLIPSITFS